MTDRERLVGVLAADALPVEATSALLGARWAPLAVEFLKSRIARQVLAALEAAGYAIYRPDECRKIVQGAWRCRSCGEDCRLGEPCPDADYDDRTYYLVPVGGDS